ncbi:MAG: hypothetical protein WC750_06045 [Patescibacteria group bacterium]|jgi:hypothetical protein
MANATQGKFWILDSAGIVWLQSVFIKDIKITWKTASAGTVELTEVSADKGEGATILYAATLGATSAAGDQLTQVFPIDNIVEGLSIKTIVNVAKLIVNVK